MLRFRTFVTSDADIIKDWTSDEYSFRLWSADRYDRYPISGKDICDNYERQSGTLFPFVMEDDGKVIGHLTIRYLDESRRNVRLGFIIVDPEARGKGYGKKLIDLAFEYAFKEMEADEVSLAAFDANPAACNCYKACGFKEYATDEVEYMHIFDEEWKRILMRISKAEYEYKIA